MREILFRGKRLDNMAWIEGSLIQHDLSMICGDDEQRRVDPETVDQYTGLKDKNGHRIFEGDIIKAVMNGGNYDQYEFPIGQVVFENGAFCLRDRRETTPLCSFAPAVSFEVIGDVHDTPELLGSAEGEEHDD